jgi:hypothetical protein
MKYEDVVEGKTYRIKSKEDIAEFVRSDDYDSVACLFSHHMEYLHGTDIVAKPRGGIVAHCADTTTPSESPWAIEAWMVEELTNKIEVCGGTVEVTLLTGETVMREAFAATSRCEIKTGIGKAAACGHSPIRTVMFKVEMLGIPLFVSTHLLRHTIGIEHFVRTQRTDRGGTVDEGRMSPHDHTMFLNAESLISMAKKRLCLQSSKETVKVMKSIRAGVEAVMPDLATNMVPECLSRNGLCPEIYGSCGCVDTMMDTYSAYLDQFKTFSKYSRVATETVPVPSANKFKLGDIIRVVGNDSGSPYGIKHFFDLGDEFEVIGINDSEYFAGKSGKHYSGYIGSLKQSVHEDDLELASDIDREAQAFLIEDVVRVKSKLAGWFKFSVGDEFEVEDVRLYDEGFIYFGTVDGLRQGVYQQDLEEVQ